MSGTGWKVAGGAAVALYAVHAVVYVLKREPGHLLWFCHLGLLAVGVGLITGIPLLNGVGTFWLAVGVPLWILDVATGGGTTALSTVNHLAGITLGFSGLMRLGLPRHTWWISVVALLAVVGITRLTTAPAGNVNLAHAVWKGWERTFPSYPLYFLMLLGIYSLGALLLQLTLPRLGIGVEAAP